MRLLRRAETDGPQNVDWMARTKDGTLFSVSVSIRFLQTNGQARCVVSARRVTPQH